MHDLYLFYGATFFSMGVVLAFQARLPATILPRLALWFLAGFGLAHGLSEWTQSQATIPRSSHDREVLKLAGVLFGVVSYASLSQFAIFVLAPSGRSRWLVVLPVMLSIAFVVVIVIRIQGGIDLEMLRSVDAVSRYVFALPASLLAAAALWALRRETSDRVRLYLAGATAVFLAYAVLSGVIVSSAPFFPASVVSSEAFRDVIHVRIEVFRIACAVGLLVFLSGAFVIQASRERQELMQRREEFISIVAHDLRSPIGVITLGADLLEQQLESKDSKALDQSTQKSLESIRRSARGLERMVKDLLDASRIETRMLALNRTAVELCPLVSDIVDRARDQLRGHPVRLVMPDRLPRVDADPMRVEQILVNLLSNAAKYSAPRTEITLEATVLPSEVELRLTNEGPGLTDEEIGQVFSRFYRSKHVGKVEGLGIGLYIAKGLVDAQGGRMWVESEPGRFTTFHFTLVRTDATPGLVEAPAGAGTSPAGQLATEGAR